MTGLPHKLPAARDYGILLSLGVIWGLSFTLVKISVGTIPALPLTLIRVALTAVLMTALMLYLRERLPAWGRIWGFVALSALLGNSLPFLLIAWGQEKVDGSLAAILMSPSPLAAAVLAHIFTRDDKLNGHKLAGIALGIIGIAVLMGLHNVSRIGDDWPYQLMLLAAAVSYGANVVANRGLVGGSAVGNITAVMLVSVVIMAPLAFVPGVWRFSPSTGSLAALGILVVMSNSLGTIIMLMLVRRAGPAFTAQVNFLVPVFGVITAALLLAERPPARAIAGLALVLAGVAVARRGAGLRPQPRSA